MTIWYGLYEKTNETVSQTRIRDGGADREQPGANVEDSMILRPELVNTF